jgi:pyruvate dehydrogenase E2 component (dihydrolipoamide acetyltransferase)
MYEFKIPDIGEGVTDGEIVKWLVKPGDMVSEDQPLLEIMTDKVNAVIPSPVAGKVDQIMGKEGEKVKVGQVVLTIATAASGTKSSVGIPPQNTRPVDDGGRPQAERTEAQSGQQGGVLGARVLAPPSVRKLARELGVDLNSVAGSGPGGRITESDVRNYSNTSSAGTPAAAVSPPANESPVKGSAQPSQTASEVTEERIPLRGLRRSVAEKMVKSAFTAPHVTHFDEADVTELVKLRELFRPLAETKGVKLTFIPFIIKMLSVALKEYPYLNATLEDSSQEIILHKYYNIGIATSVEGGLVVPVVKHADQKTIFEIASEVARLSDQARSGKLTLSDVQGGTFTVTSIGNIGGVFATPIINHPEVAILGIYKIAKRPVYSSGGQLEARDILNFSVTFDHRVLDGAVAATFAQRFKQLLADPQQLVAYLI